MLHVRSVINPHHQTSITHNELIQTNQDMRLQSTITIFHLLVKCHDIQSFAYHKCNLISKQQRIAKINHNDVKRTRMIPRRGDNDWDEHIMTNIQSNTATTSTRRRILGSLAASFTISSLFPFVEAKAMYTDPVTKILLPSLGEIESVIPSSFFDDDNDDNPFETLDRKTDFSRLDNTPDADFYKYPRFTEHVDDHAVQIMTQYIASPNVLQPNYSVLDLCSSWTSHIDTNTVEKLNLTRVAGLGMNQEELQANSVLTDYVVMDLNAKADVKLPYDDSMFDVVLCQLSIDYLIYPLEVLKEVGRVLKPGGKVVILFSNRLFIQKVSYI
mmetsp:Transcript_1481/g.2691  ORF Transcript_1481/g.2691 Transcript_1481/m.2691 type:complete len:328 (-) Transcript_1481:2107-3090(-)